MNANIQKQAPKEQTIIKKCHCCGQVIESDKEIQKCPACKKSFLPLNYFDKVHSSDEKYEFQELFSDGHQLYEEDLIKGLYVLW